MKDKVFIAWSGTNEEAKRVKDILEKKYNYVCSIGGNSDNNSTYSSVGDTVLQQIKTCNQAIVIFEKRADGAVSNNLLFELGYVLAKYGTKKVHCVKRANEEIVLPSDFDNSFVEPIEAKDESSSFSRGIVDYFIGRQKMSINENKMYLINNRYLIHDLIVSHYSASGSKCSDYELAQYILFYMQAAHLFGDERKIQKEIFEFKRRHYYEFSHELSLAVNICLAFFDLVLNIQAKEGSQEVYVEQNVYWHFRSEYTQYCEQVVDDDIGIFDEWANVFLYQHMNFGNMLFANNEALPEEKRRELYEETVKAAHRAIEAIERLEEEAPCIENNDSMGILSLFKAYVFRNLFISERYLGKADAADWLKKTMRERASLKNNFANGTIDSQIYNTFCMEYYLSIISYLSEKSDKDAFETAMYKSEIEEYLGSVQKEQRENIYLRQLTLWCENTP